MNLLAELYIGLLVLISAIYVLQFLAYWWAWTRIPRLAQIPDQDDSGIMDLKVSIVIPARNEARNIANCLSSVLDQSYSSEYFEILVVDDFSEDGTVEIIRNYQRQFSNIQLISLSDFPEEQLQFKKAGIQKAVEKASGELIICTDADTHRGHFWLESIVEFYLKTRSRFIAGPVSFNSGQNLLSHFQELDFMSLVGIGGASIQLGFQNICNGANMAFHRESFFEVGAYEGIDDQPSGDDMMLMHKIARRFPGSVGFLKEHMALVQTHAEATFADFWEQRTRWASKSTRYEDRRITLLLIAVYLMNLSIPLNMLLGIWDPFWFRIGLSQFILKVAFDTLFQYPVARFFHKTHLLWRFLPLQVLHIVYVILMGPWSMIRPYKWKGRKIKAAHS